MRMGRNEKEEGKAHEVEMANKNWKRGFPRLLIVSWLVSALIWWVYAISILSDGSDPPVLEVILLLSFPFWGGLLLGLAGWGIYLIGRRIYRGSAEE